MKRDLLAILVCPVCRGPLALQAEREEDDEVQKGSLTCERCKETYPIDAGIPNLLPPGLRASESG